MKAPRFVTRALVTSFLTVTLVLGAVFGVLVWQVRQTVADSPTLKAALDLWLTEHGFASDRIGDQLVATVQREADKIAALPRLVTTSEPFDPVVFQWARHRARSA